MIEENIFGPQIGKVHDQLEKKKKKVNCASNKLKKNLIFMDAIRIEKESTDWKKIFAILIPDK